MMIQRGIILMLGFYLCLGKVSAQDYALSSESTCTLSGTSTLASWTAEVEEINGTLNLGEAFGSNELPSTGTTVAGASISIPVASITGARGDAMTTKIHNAFKHVDHPAITFNLDSGSITEITDAEAGTFVLTASGKLAMAGVEKDVSVPFNATRLDNGKYKFECVYKLDMTTYDIVPPSAMFGQIVCGEEVSIIFSLLTE